MMKNWRITFLFILVFSNLLWGNNLEKIEGYSKGDFVISYLNSGGKVEDFIILRKVPKFIFIKSESESGEEKGEIKSKKKDDMKELLKEGIKILITSGKDKNVNKKIDKNVIEKIEKKRDKYVIHYKGGTEELPLYKSNIKWFSIGKNKGKIVAVKWIDLDAKKRRYYINKEGKITIIKNFEDVIQKGGSFEKSLLKKGGSLPIIPIIENVFDFNFNKIKPGFRYQVLTMWNMTKGREELQALKMIHEEEKINISAVNIAGRFRDKKGNEYPLLGKKLPVYEGDIEISRRKNIETAYIATKLGSEVFSFGEGTVVYSSVDELVMIINYNSGFCVYYDNIEPALEAGKKLSSSEIVIGKSGDGLFFEGRAGALEGNFTDKRTALSHFEKLLPLKLVDFLPPKNSEKNKNILEEISLWFELMDFFSESNDWG